MNNLGYKFSLLVIASAILLSLLSIFPVVTVKGKYEVNPNVIPQGGQFEFITHYCKYLPLPSKYQITFVDKDNLEWPTTDQRSSNLGVGCSTGRIKLEIPDNLPPNTYYFRLTAYYPPVLRSFNFESEEFQVVKGDTLKNKVDEIIGILKEWEEIDE